MVFRLGAFVFTYGATTGGASLLGDIRASYRRYRKVLAYLYEEEELPPPRRRGRGSRSTCPLPRRLKRIANITVALSRDKRYSLASFRRNLSTTDPPSCAGNGRKFFPARRTKIEPFPVATLPLSPWAIRRATHRGCQGATITYAQSVARPSRLSSMPHASSADRISLCAPRGAVQHSGEN